MVGVVYFEIFVIAAVTRHKILKIMSNYTFCSSHELTEYIWLYFKWFLDIDLIIRRVPSIREEAYHGDPSNRDLAETLRAAFW